MNFKVAYKLGMLRAKLEGESAQLCDEIVDLIEKDENKDGYVNIPFINDPLIQRKDTITPTLDLTGTGVSDNDRINVTI